MLTRSHIVVCKECDLILRSSLRPAGKISSCPRCRATIRKHNPYALEKSLALLIAACIAFIIANSTPLLSIEAQGQTHASSLLEATHSLWKDDMKSVATLVFSTTFLAPALEIFSLTFILSSAFLGLRASLLPRMLRLVMYTKPWSMVEIFMLGVLVSIVKLSHLAHISPGPALWSYGLLLVFFASAMTILDTQALWARLSDIDTSELN